MTAPVKANLVKKLSAKVLVGQVKSYVKDLQNGQSVELFRVVGIAHGIKSGISNFGEWTSLMGQFVAEPLIGDKKGQRFRTGQLFLPDVMLNMIAPLVADKANRGIELAFVVSAIKDDTANNDYFYSGDFLSDPAENDPLEALVAKALPAPEKVKEDKPAAAKA